MQSRSRVVIILGLVGVGLAAWFLAPAQNLPLSNEVAQASAPATSELTSPVQEPDVPLVNEPDLLGVVPVPDYSDYRKGWPFSEGKK